MIACVPVDPAGPLTYNLGPASMLILNVLRLGLHITLTMKSTKIKTLTKEKAHSDDEIDEDITLLNLLTACATYNSSPRPLGALSLSLFLLPARLRETTPPSPRIGVSRKRTTVPMIGELWKLAMGLATWNQ
jgi:hypothetical protein